MFPGYNSMWLGKSLCPGYKSTVCGLGRVYRNIKECSSGRVYVSVKKDYVGSGRIYVSRKYDYFVASGIVYVSRI